MDKYQIEKAYEELSLLNKKSKVSRGNVFCTILSEEDGVDKRMLGPSCHGGMAAFDSNHISTFMVTSFNETRGRYNKENFLPQLKDWMYWVMNDSVYAHTFFSKDVDEALNLGIIQETIHPANEMLAGAHLFRQCWEDAGIERILVWHRLAFEYKINRELALILSTFVKYKFNSDFMSQSQKTANGDISLNRSSTGRDTIQNWEMRIADACAFIRKEKQIERPSYKKNKSYSYIFKMFLNTPIKGKKGKIELMNWVKDTVVFEHKEKMGTDSWGDPVKLPPHFSSEDTCVEALAELADEFRKNFMARLKRW